MFILVGQVISTLNYYVATFLPPAVVALGGLGNLFSLLVFILSPLRKIRSSPFLIGLTTAHLTALTCIFLVWLQRLGIFLVGQPGWCQVLNYLFHVANMLGVCFVLAFTVERYISFCWQRNSGMRGNGARMHRKCVIVTIVLVIIVAAFYTFLLGMLQSKGDACKFGGIPGMGNRTKKIPKYILYFSYIIIGLMLLVTLGLDMSIMITIIRRRQNSKDGSPKFGGSQVGTMDSRSLHKDFGESVDNLSIGQADDLVGGGVRDNTMQKGKSLPRPLRIIRSRELRRSRSLLSIRSTINATKMLFAASLTFTMLQICFVGVQFFQGILFYAKLPMLEFSGEDLIYNLFASLYILSLAIGFVVYMFCGHNFREAVKMLLTCQYGRCIAHSHCRCCRRKRKRVISGSENQKPPMITVDDDDDDGGFGSPKSQRGQRGESPHPSSRPVAVDSVSRYIDDGSHYSVRA